MFLNIPTSSRHSHRFWKSVHRKWSEAGAGHIPFCSCVDVTARLVMGSWELDSILERCQLSHSTMREQNKITVKAVKVKPKPKCDKVLESRTERGRREITTSSVDLLTGRTTSGTKKFITGNESLMQQIATKIYIGPVYPGPCVGKQGN